IGLLQQVDRVLAVPVGNGDGGRNQPAVGEEPDSRGHRGEPRRGRMNKAARDRPQWNRGRAETTKLVALADSAWRNAPLSVMIEGRGRSFDASSITASCPPTVLRVQGG